MSKVLVLDSDYENCNIAVDQAFAMFPIDFAGKKVAVKMNALKAGDPDSEAFVTNYHVLEGVIQKLETYKPSQIVAGDSVGTEFYGKSELVFNTTRLKQAAGRYYRNFNKNITILEVDQPFQRKVAVLKDVLDADIYISVPKMKTHGLTRISGSVKNNYGLLVGAQKAWYHYYSQTPETFARIVIEMFRLRPPDLVIMDGILAMEGYGPASPETRWVNKILVSNDAVALDTVLAHMVGFTVEDVPYLQLAREMSLGETDLAAIEIVGDAATIEAYHRPDPPVSSYSYKAGVGSGRMSIEFFRDRVAYRPSFSADVCQHPKGCNSCVDICPSGAITRGKAMPRLDPEKCLLCSACMEACEHAGLVLAPDAKIVQKLTT